MSHKKRNPGKPDWKKIDDAIEKLGQDWKFMQLTQDDKRNKLKKSGFNDAQIGQILAYLVP